MLFPQRVGGFALKAREGRVEKAKFDKTPHRTGGLKGNVRHRERVKRGSSGHSR